ncbi:MAG: RNA polymerase sigma-70 factor [Tannerella sp.]|jgi:RNA polymerase sigma-70 factor (ECF subfamily)|nr:RNA polymerase sigma-70 factor [Tannerella sp.]
MENTAETDALLMEGVRKDNYISYNQLFVRYYQPLCRFVYGFIADRPDTEDIVQELFLHLWHRRKSIEITGSVSGYLYKMARNMTLNHIRRETGYKMLLERMETAPLYEEEHPMEAHEFRMALRDCLNRLSARSREILLLDRMKGLRQKEIAEKLNIAVKTVKNQIWMSLQKLKLCLENKGIEK